MFVLINDTTDTLSICGLTWDQIFILDGILQRAISEMKNPFINEYLNEILLNIEAAEERIFEDY